MLQNSTGDLLWEVQSSVQGGNKDTEQQGKMVT